MGETERLTVDTICELQEKIAKQQEVICNLNEEQVKQLQLKNKELEKTIKKAKQQARIMKSCKTVDIQGSVIETGKCICAYHELLKILGV